MASVREAARLANARAFRGTRRRNAALLRDIAEISSLRDACRLRRGPSSDYELRVNLAFTDSAGRRWIRSGWDSPVRVITIDSPG
jgi:hypothetical protein